MTTKFWGNPNNIPVPKRKFRFQLHIGDLWWWAKTVKKPSFTVDDEAEVSYLNHTFYYPGRVKWDPISITVVDSGTPDMAGSFMGFLNSMGYRYPTDTNAASYAITKKQAVKGLGGKINIALIGEHEGIVFEEWQLHNPWIQKVDFGELDYGSGDMVEISFDVKYDFAKIAILDPNNITAQAAKDLTPGFITKAESGPEPF